MNTQGNKSVVSMSTGSPVHGEEERAASAASPRRRTAKPLRVMQSFGPPRPTSNPYIHMLDESLAHTPDLIHQRFGRARAFFGRYDAIHFHWPETLFGTGRG